MKRIICFALFAIICTISAEDCENKCKPNTYFLDGCSPCFCTKDGNIVCAQRSCPIPPPIDPSECKPGTSFDVDCNTCTCNDDGISLRCTEIACAVPLA